jgi:hypothetical protein
VFGLFKKSFGDFNESRYFLLASAASINSLSVTLGLLRCSSKEDERTFMLLYNEVLAFSVCLGQMMIQKKYKLRDHTDIITIIQQFQEQFAEMPVPSSIPPGQDITVTRNMLENATTEEFFERVALYAARDYRGLQITDEALAAVCKMTGQVPAIIKGAGWTMALLIFQIRTSTYLLEESEMAERITPMMGAVREGCQFMMEKFEGILSR